MRVLVTGGAGYIGSVVTSILIESGHQVASVDDFSNSSDAGLDDRAENYNFSIHNTHKLTKVLDRCEAVIHLAASSIVSESVINPTKYIYNNIEGTKSLLKAMAISNVPKLIFSSSCSVYSSNGSQLIDEKVEYKPVSPYAQSKLDSDLMIKEFAMTEKIEATVFRFFNVSGAYTNDGLHWKGEMHIPETHLIPSILLAIKKGLPVSVYGDNWNTPDGSCIRDYVHVVDIAKAFELSLRTIQSSNYEIYNLGSGIGQSVFEVIKEIEKALGQKIRFQIESKRNGDSASLVADPRKAIKSLNWSPDKSFVKIIEDNISFFNHRI